MVRQLLIGLPGVGKTTFLAALWWVVDSEEVPSSLKLKELVGDRTYLNKIRDSWVRCNPVGRTLPSAEEITVMQLLDEINGITTEVIFPDLSGESFREQWEKRRWTKKYGNLVSKTDGALLFVHPSEVKESIRIDLANELIGTLEEQDSSDPRQSDEIIDWNPKFASTQVKLIDLLQFISPPFEHKKPFRIAVIISAWDLVRSQGKPPDAWLATTLPLLNQFLTANSDQFDTRVYGISAIGGDLENDVCQLRKTVHYSERIIVEGFESDPNDITAPIRWLMRKPSN